MRPIAFVFPGQGSQYVGMGRDLYETYPEARAVFEKADETLGFPLSELCFEGPAEELNDTINTQPAIFTMSVACLRALNPLFSLNPLFVAGHSLGEYTALVAAGALDFAAGLKLVRERGRLMKEAGEKNPGAMAAIIGLDAGTIERICREICLQLPASSVQIANYNSPGQIVISGHRGALERAMELARERGAKRVIPLAVSIAAHSPLMRPAAEELRRAVEATPLRRARIPIVANVTARPIAEPEEIKEELVRQLTSPVRWVESVERMIEGGITTFVEIGPKSVLAGLIRRIDKGVRTVNVGDVAGVKAAGFDCCLG
ncbi:MAG TPA: ACP S-malonyltransferase [Anaerolineae bacterium]|nr:ACP S-malonyltransferase [Anaerolineae bacterium]